MSTAANEIYSYKVGGSLDVNHPTYVVRQADKDFYDRLKRGEFCYVLNSRQTGKSSLRVQTMYKLQAEGIACADIDLTGIVSKRSTEEEWYRDIIKELVSCFQLKVNRRTWWREHDDLSCVHRFSVFVEEVLLAQVTQNIVIFVDEIDSVLSLDFPIDDFFAQIRYFYNRRANKAEYKRLTFALLGVAMPSDLIADKNRTPFNLGRAIELYGFQPHEAAPLAQGLVGKVSNPQAVLREVLQWTGGQPFLTQKLCQLVLIAELSIPEGNEAEWVENLVRSHVIENWESQDDPEHLRTIRDRILRNEQRTSRLLGLYQQILIPPQPPLIKGGQGGIVADDSSEQMELRLSGLVVKQHGKLRVYNHIYEAVFNQSWVNQQLAKLRPYSEAITAWLKSNRQDESRLLRGKALQDALAWATDKSLGAEDYQFFAASQQLAMQEIQRALEAERQAKQILEDARREAKEGTKIERVGIKALQLFEAGDRQIEALLLAMQAGQALRELVKDGRPVQEYPATSPLLALQQILDHVRVRNQFTGHGMGRKTVSFSPNWEYVATASSEGIVELWDLFGNQIAAFQGSHQRLDKITIIIFSPNGKLLATGLSDGTIKLWDLSGNQVAKFEDGGWEEIEFTPNGEYRAILSNPSTVKLWDLSGNRIAELKESAWWSRSFSPNGEYIADASSYGTARLWDSSGNQIAEFCGHEDYVYCVKFSPDGQYIATYSSDGTVRLWDLSPTQIAELKGHEGELYSVIFSPDGQYIATSSEDDTARLWDLSGNQIAKFKADSPTAIDVSFSPNGQYLATYGYAAKLWDLSGNQIAQFQEHQEIILSISFSSDGKYIATASEDGIVKLSDLSGNQLAEFTGYKVSFSPDSKYLLTSSEDNITRLWDLSGNNILQFLGHQGMVTNVSFSPHGEYIATASIDDNTVRLWDWSGNQITQFQGNQDRIMSLSFSPCGEYVATASTDGKARLWDLAGKQLAELKGSQWSSVIIVSFSPNGERLTTASMDGTIKLWNLSGNQIAEFHKYYGRVTSITFSPDGEHLAIASTDGMVQLRNNLYRYQSAEEFTAHRGEVNSVSFSPDGQYLATGSDDGKARLWDLSANLLAEFQGHQDRVTSVSFSPKGEYLATSSSDGTARLWDLTGNQIAEFKEHQGGVNSVSFSPDGKYLATASDDGTARLWRVETLDELLARGCDWLKYYLASHPEAREKLKVCQNLSF
jgi:WD40 repeat protein